MFWLASVFSDQRWVVEEVLGDGDLVAIHLTHHGRQTGELMGIPPTGREVAYDYVHFLRFRNGKAIEQWRRTRRHDSHASTRCHSRASGCPAAAG